jgi:hypothetical protein
MCEGRLAVPIAGPNSDEFLQSRGAAAPDEEPLALGNKSFAPPKILPVSSDEMTVRKWHKLMGDRILQVAAFWIEA